MNSIEIYTGSDNQVQIEVTFDNDTLWLSLNQISDLFERDKSVISRHLKNIFNSGELSYSATVAKSATVQNEAGREVVRWIDFYNLDAILSIGYKVNSKRGNQFRQWSTQRLTDYLVQGYALNQKRLEQLQKIVNVISNSCDNESLKLNEAKGLLNI